MELMNAFLPAIGDKATKTASYWSYKALNSWNQPAIQKCSDGTGELAGVVTTNALTYSSGPPTFDQDSGSLIYKVASPHFEANGDVARGSYDLALRADVARCMYGFSKAPIRAEISITSSDGSTQEIASEMLIEKDGWFYLSAKNFTFSSPTLKVKLMQDKPKEVVVETKPEVAKPAEEVAVAVKPNSTLTLLKVIAPDAGNAIVFYCSFFLISSLITSNVFIITTSSLLSGAKYNPGALLGKFNPFVSKLLFPLWKICLYCPSRYCILLIKIHTDQLNSIPPLELTDL
jgi:hypothetical protein